MEVIEIQAFAEAREGPSIVKAHKIAPGRVVVAVVSLIACIQIDGEEIGVAGAYVVTGNAPAVQTVGDIAQGEELIAQTSPETDPLPLDVGDIHVSGNFPDAGRGAFRIDSVRAGAQVHPAYVAESGLELGIYGRRLGAVIGIEEGQTRVRAYLCIEIEA